MGAVLMGVGVGEQQLCGVGCATVVAAGVSGNFPIEIVCVPVTRHSWTATPTANRIEEGLGGGGMTPVTRSTAVGVRSMTHLQSLRRSTRKDLGVYDPYKNQTQFSTFSGSASFCWDAFR